jgi:hypothetical protein
MKTEVTYLSGDFFEESPAIIDKVCKKCRKIIKPKEKRLIMANMVTGSYQHEVVLRWNVYCDRCTQKIVDVLDVKII